ncbi:MAG: hypothetical protein ABSA84_02750 [Gammaproteobacteria bacterium]
MSCGLNWKLYKKSTTTASKISRLEYNLGQLQKNSLQNIETITQQLTSSTERLQQKFTELANSIGQVEATEPGYQLRSTLRLTTLAAMELILNKGEPLAKELLKQAINKLIKINDTRLNPILYNLQDEYNYLLNEDNNITTQEVFQKITQLQQLLEQLQKSEFPEVEMSDLFIDSKSNNPLSKTSYFTIEVLNIYLEQVKLAFAQNNEFLYKQALAAFNKTLKLVFWAPEATLKIQEHLSWLENVEIKNYPLLLQAILNLEDLL